MGYVDGSRHRCAKSPNIARVSELEGISDAFQRRFLLHSLYDFLKRPLFNPQVRNNCLFMKILVRYSLMLLEVVFVPNQY